MPAIKQAKKISKASSGAKKYRIYSAPRRTVSGRGSYYVRGNVGASARLPYVGKAKFNVGAGYTSGSTAMSRLKGLGSYSQDRIKRNVLIRPDPPSVYNKFVDDGMSTVIRHREFVKNITSSATAGAFQLESFPVNPAMDALFPWLSTIAQNFEEYQFEGVCLEFQSTSSDAIASSTNLALGSIMMASQYDPVNPDFTNAQSLLNYDWAQSGKVSNNVYHYLECDPRQNLLSKFYTRQGDEPNDDLRMCDLAKFSIATEGLQGTSVLLGRLWVSYQVRLFKPKLASVEGEAGGFFHWYNATAMTTFTPFGDIASGFIRPESNLYVLVGNTSSNGTIRLPTSPQNKSYCITVSYNGASTASIQAPTATSSAGISSLDMLNDNTFNQIAFPSAASTQTLSCLTRYISVAGNTAAPIVSVQMAAMLTTPKLDVMVTEIPWIDPALYP